MWVPLPICIVGYIIGLGDHGLTSPRLSKTTAVLFGVCQLLSAFYWKSPLTALTSIKCVFVWTPEADSTFQKLKGQFTIARIFQVPDPNQRFVVDVDVSDPGVGGVLSQRALIDQKHHTCTFFSHWMFPAGRNYAIGNKELALKEWQHWLKRARQQSGHSSHLACRLEAQVMEEMLRQTSGSHPVCEDLLHL